MPASVQTTPPSASSKGNTLRVRRMRDHDWQIGYCHQRAHRNGFHRPDARELAFGLRGGAGVLKNSCIGCSKDGSRSRWRRSRTLMCRSRQQMSRAARRQRPGHGDRRYRLRVFYQPPTVGRYSSAHCDGWQQFAVRWPCSGRRIFWWFPPPSSSTTLASAGASPGLFLAAVGGRSTILLSIMRSVVRRSSAPNSPQYWAMRTNALSRRVSNDRARCQSTRADRTYV